MASIFELTLRPNDNVFYKKNDPNDLKMGERVTFDQAGYEHAEIVILGCPEDEGVRRNHGRTGAALAPDRIREQFYRLAVPAPVRTVDIFDLGDLHVQSTLEETHTHLELVVQQLLADEKMVIVLGGGNDISYPDCKALAQSVHDVLAFNVDTHLDVRADSPRNSGTPYRRLLEDGCIRADKFYEMAIQCLVNSPDYLSYVKEKGAHVYSLKRVHDSGIRHILMDILGGEHADAIFWGLDMDAVKSADAPGVSASLPTGLSATEMCEIAAVAGADKRTAVFEITEVNPKYDIDNRTCKLASLMMLHFLNSYGSIS